MKHYQFSSLPFAPSSRGRPPERPHKKIFCGTCDRITPHDGDLCKECRPAPKP